MASNAVLKALEERGPGTCVSVNDDGELAQLTLAGPGTYSEIGTFDPANEVTDDELTQVVKAAEESSSRAITFDAGVEPEIKQEPRDTQPVREPEEDA